MEPERFIKQARTKMRIIARREMAEFMSGERNYLPGMTNQREQIMAVQIAFNAGRDAERREAGE